jgi:hypothetical protein
MCDQSARLNHGTTLGFIEPGKERQAKKDTRRKSRMESQAPRELDPVMQLTSDVTLQLLPSEVLDMITEKVRGHSPQSFRAIGRTCRELRDSARRCAQTLIIEHCNPAESDSRVHGSTEEGDSKVQGTTEECEVSDFMGKAFGGISATPSQILSREMSMRPLLSSLRLVTAGWPGTDPGVLEALSGVSWKEVTFFSATAEATSVSENDSLILPLLSSKESLRGLSLNQCSLPSEILRELLGRLSNLGSLKLGSCKIRNYQPTTTPLRLENLTELDVSGTTCKVHSGGVFVHTYISTSQLT